MRAALTDALIKELCLWIENGNTVEDACLLSSISKSAFYDWMARGRESQEGGLENIYSEFVDGVKKAEAKFKAFHIQRISKASTVGNNWQASAWLLERKYPKQFSRMERNEITKTEDTGKVNELVALLKERRGTE